MSQQQRRTLQQLTTTLPPADVLAAAKAFFARRNGIYAAFLEKEGPTYVAMRGQGGEEVLIGALPKDGVTEVTGSSYLFDQQIARFLSSLPTPGTAQGADVGVAETGGVVADGAPS